MEVIPKKFRAKCETGELITFELGEEIPQGIDTTTITQLVGYDKNGKEVYEGDALKDVDGEYYVPFLEARVIWNATFGAMWTLPFERPHSRAARRIDLMSMSFDFWNRIEKVRRKDKKKEKWLKAVEDDERHTD